ncbi:hypothetical protein EGW08_023341 [Elysia chlorotica]|uniref:Bis(monoacylglycero)phosphate synthase CLN5 n=1 Tax=Elysia chlorotica TaxID=188477 RepID=A0A3S1B0I9_ELYCH|nr:hypothetical protein EGW08_023341 [Elysia chlorotica]
MRMATHLLLLPVLCVMVSSLLQCAESTESTPAPVWPPHQRTYDHRPTSDPYCTAGIIPFCPTGLPPGQVPKVKETDTLFVYAMKAPVWEFRYGSLLKKFDIMHDAIGFHHVESGLNITMEWYELFQLFNCTFPHLRSEGKDSYKLQWCNQGAACLYMGIDEKHWKENGTLVKISQISGDIFNNFITWSLSDNTTYPFYETWTVMAGPGKNTWFNPFDCASWVLRAFDAMHDLGAKFDQSVHLNYTKVVLYSQQPILIGNASSIYNDSKTLETLVDFYNYFQKRTMADIVLHMLEFYNYFQKRTMADIVLHMLEYLAWFELHKKFYIFYNAQYWELDMVQPYFQLTYDEVPLPSKH